jgi:hypothetical protein
VATGWRPSTRTVSRIRRDLGRLLDAALDADALLVYGQPLNPPPSHGLVRNALSSIAKAVAAVIVGSRPMAHFNSFRLVRGDR